MATSKQKKPEQNKLKKEKIEPYQNHSKLLTQSRKTPNNPSFKTDILRGKMKESGVSTGGGITDSPLHGHGPTLSTSTSSFEALDPHDPNLSRLATKMFHKTNEYISHELNTCLEDYRLLEDMNKATISKYSDMDQIAESLTVSSADLKQKYEELVPDPQYKFFI